MSSARMFGHSLTARRIARSMSMELDAPLGQTGGGSSPGGIVNNEEWLNKWARGLCESMGHSPGSADFNQCVSSLKSKASMSSLLSSPRSRCVACASPTRHGPARRLANRLLRKR